MFLLDVGVKYEKHMCSSLLVADWSNDQPIGALVTAENRKRRPRGVGSWAENECEAPPRILESTNVTLQNSKKECQAHSWFK